MSNFISILLLISIVIFSSVQGVLKKVYNIKFKDGDAFIFSAGTTFFAIIVFVANLIISGAGFVFAPEYIPYSILFALCYALSTVFGVLAINIGSLSLTSLVSSYSLIIPAIYGILFWNEEISIWLIVGIVLLCISLFFINYTKEKDSKLSLKWIIFVLISFFANGGCSVVQRAQQLNCDLKFKNEFMIIALIFACLSMLIAGIIKNKKSILPKLTKGSWTFLICGISNGIVNLLVIILTPVFNASVMFPVIGAGGIILTAMISLFFFKEKLSMQQWIGMGIGVLSIIALNL